jgi:hypothetical protein
MSQLQGYGFVSDSDESLKTKTGARFGGNFGVAFLTKFAYNANVAKEGQPAREAIELEVTVGERSYKEWINPVDRVVDKNNAEITDKTSQAYIDGFNTLIVQQNATVTHYLKAVGVTEEALKVSFANPVHSFVDYATRICALLPLGYDKKPLDLFLEYQWNFGKKADGSLQDKTYTTLPKNMKGGYFIVPAQPGVWVEKKDENGQLEDGKLVYVNSNGQKHPFERDANYMSSNKGTQQVMGASATASPMGAMGATAATSSTWS